MKAIFSKFKEKKRTYEDGDIYKFNKKYDRKKMFYVVFENQDILTTGKFNPIAKKLNDKKRNKLISASGNIILIHSVRRAGANFNNPSNIIVSKYKVICVGNKRPTTGAPAGLLFQFEMILPK